MDRRILTRHMPTSHLHTSASSKFFVLLTVKIFRTQINKNPTEWYNNSNLCKSQNFCKLPCTFASFLYIFSWTLLRKEIFSRMSTKILCHKTICTKKGSFVPHVAKNVCLFLINSRKSPHFLIWTKNFGKIFAKICVIFVYFRKLKFLPNFTN
jgi:hypothetical protein